MRESNQGRAVWFADDMDALSQRLAQADASATAATSDIYDFQRGNAPLLISIPTWAASCRRARARMTEAGLRSGDTDWHLDTLYGWARGAGRVGAGARYSRYVVDLNRPSDDASLYPGQTKTGLCPTHTFRGEPIYRDGAEPTRPSARAGWTRTGGPTTTSCAWRSNASAPSMAPCCCGKRTPSPACCRACSRASCPT